MRASNFSLGISISAILSYNMLSERGCHQVIRGLRVSYDSECDDAEIIMVFRGGIFNTCGSLFLNSVLSYPRDPGRLYPRYALNCSHMRTSILELLIYALITHFDIVRNLSISEEEQRILDGELIDRCILSNFKQMAPREWLKKQNENGILFDTV